MSLELATIVYLFSVVFIITILTHAGFKIWGASVLAVTIGMILLLIMKSPTDINPWVESESVSAVYTLIIIGTPIMILIYSLISAFHDRRI